MAEVTIIIAFIAGLVSFISPCILPLIPGYLSYLSGVSIAESDDSKKAIIFLNTLAFVIGFSLVFSILGVLLNGALAGAAYDIKIWLGRIGGIIIILFGLVLLKIIRIPFLERQHRIGVKRFRASYLSSFLFGLAFAAGWTPCIGAVLASILALAAVSAQNAFYLLLAYSLGLSLPFLITGLFVSQMQTLIEKHEKTLAKVNMAFGAILVLLGILVFTNSLGAISSFSLAQGFLGG